MADSNSFEFGSRSTLEHFDDSSRSERSSSPSNAASENIAQDQATALTENQLCCASQSESQDYKTMEASASGGMDRFLQKMRSDLMYELRNIELGEKPVTGQNHREQIQQFLEKHVVTDDDNGVHSRPREAPEIQRPEAVVVEVQGIIEQRRVSSVLQSPAFRRQLENVIRGSIQSTQRAAPIPRPRRTRATDAAASSTFGTPQTERRTPLSVPSSASNRQEPVPRIVEDVSVVRPRITRQDSSDSISSVDSFSSARSSADNDGLDELDEALPTVPHSEPLAQTQHSPSHALDRNRQSAQRGTDTDTGMRNLTWSDINRVQRDELVEEISDLLHSQLVTSTLDGEFRATLELLVQNRVEASGTNGRQVENVIRSLPHGGVVRNDFTHLGIPNTELDNQDNISVTSFSAHSVPYTQTNTHLTREVQSLKSQIVEMKNMLKLTFDLQMDIQRAIRQEVAAAMQSFVAQGATAAPVQLPSQPINDTHCLICLDKHADSVLYQCGHMCVCYVCGKDLVSRNLGCPVCRAPIRDIIRAYKTNVE